MSRGISRQGKGDPGINIGLIFVNSGFIVCGFIPTFQHDEREGKYVKTDERYLK